MTFLPHKPASFNRVSAADRPPVPLTIAARSIERRYCVNATLALVVAQLVAAVVVRP